MLEHVILKRLNPKEGLETSVGGFESDLMRKKREIINAYQLTANKAQRKIYNLNYKVFKGAIIK